ncbi:Dabb family protein [Polaromonas jejuensis]|uniref:Dabb family protein n=1 Tax=Polaromonas jejuensis TaxID=457502 RepID=A0ABW0QKY6_9BURK|nr:Dabb family protein [Polaromonas jejuensis]
MIKHIVMWRLKDAADAPHFKAQLDSCRELVPGMLGFEVAIRTADLEANCDVVLYSVFQDSAALAAYQNHPHHQHISRGLGALRETRSVLDYEIQ